MALFMRIVQIENTAAGRETKNENFQFAIVKSAITQ